MEVPNVLGTGSSATVTITGATDDDEKEYFCRVSWGEQSVTSGAVPLNVLNILTDQSSSGL